MTVLSDARHALRSLSRTPILTVTIVLTLALGIAANATFFSIVDAVLLRPLTYSDPDRLVQIHETTPTLGRMPTGATEFEYWKTSARSFKEMSLLAVAPVIVTGGARPQRLDAARASASLFPMLGVHAALGRTFVPEEEMRGRERVVVLSDELWRARFGASPSIVGQTIVLNDIPHVVVGVLPAGFHFPRLDRLFVMGISGDRPQLWTPFAISDNDRNENSFAALARLQAGVTVEQAGKEMTALQQRLAQTMANAPQLGADVVPLQAQISGASRDTLALLWAAIAIVLLISCVNIANLLLVRAAARRTEQAIRGALGASRWQLVRHSLIDSLLLATLGGGAGILLAYAALPLVVGLAPSNLPRLDEVSIDARAVLFAAILATVAGLLIGLLPARRAFHTTLSDVIRAAGRSVTGTRRDRTVRAVMVGAQVGLTVVCLVGAGLVVQSLLNVLRVDRGFETARVLMIDVSLSPGRYPNRDARAAFATRTLTAMKRLPGVVATGFVNRPPLSGVSMNSMVALEGTENLPIPLLERPQADVRSVDAGYFTALGIPLVGGQTFDAANTARPVAVVSEAMAKRAWPRQNPIGRRFRLSAQPSRLVEVIGVVRDVHNLGLESERSATVYLPYWQMLLSGTTFVVRTTLDPAETITAARATITAIDPDVPIDAVRPMDRVVADAVSGRRFQATVLLLFAGIAALLVAIGIFGMVAYGVAQRTRELGIRLVLGASPRSIQRMILRQVLGVVLAGIAVGGPFAVAAGYGLRSVLFATSSANPWILTAACGLMLVVSGAAAWLPARRATTIDPADTLRVA